jgi:putative PIN family toxin of toxin-antitoxin system
MIKAVIDTKVYISGIFFSGTPRRLLEAVLERKFLGYVSDAILAETRRVLGRDTFHLREEQINRIVIEIEDMSEIVLPEEKVRDVCRDSEDHIILECAVQSHADFIVTGDKDLLVLKEFLGTRIVAPADFLSIIDRE